MNKLAGFGKVYALGHKYQDGLTDQPVEVTEKLDGSQFSFGVIDGELHMRSKRAVVYPNSGNKMFTPAIETAMRLADEGKLRDGWLYRGEAFQGPRHNTLRYNRVPVGNIALYGVDKQGKVGGQDYVSHAELTEIAEELGLDVVPLLYEGMVTIKILDELLETESMLGGPKIEGVVMVRMQNAPQMYGVDGKTVRAKYVCEKFKETNQKVWKSEGKGAPKNADIVEEIVEMFATDARYEKAVQAMAEQGILQNAPQDIGPGIQQVRNDAKEECRPEWGEILLKKFEPLILRGIARRFPDFYKKRLAANAFENREGGQDGE